MRVSVTGAMSFSLRSGETLYYRADGESDENPIILLHGLSQQSQYWKVVQSEMSLPSIAVDLRGHGQSQGFNNQSDYSVDRVARDLLELMDHLHIPAAHVVGHSWGASIALRLAIIAPDRIFSCTLIDGGTFNPSDLVPKFVDTISALKTLLTPPSGPFSLTDLMTHYQQIDPPTGDKIMDAISATYQEIDAGLFVSKLGLDRHMLVLDSLIAYDHISDVQRIKVPTWVILCQTGDYWDSIKENIVPLLLNNPLIHVQNWYDSVHDVPLQRPTTVANLIAEIVTTTRAT